MRRSALLRIAAAVTGLGCLVAPTAGADEPAQSTVLVHVRNGTTATAAPEGLRVEVVVMLTRESHARFTGRTGPDGTARITVPMDQTSAQTVVGMASAVYGPRVFPGDPFLLTRDEPTAEVVVTVYEVPTAGLPRWSHVALGAIMLAALGLVALRRPDRQLAG